MEKETIELVKKMIEDGNLSQEIAEKYCPELKESVDEKIRKELIEQVVFIVPNDDEVDSEGNVLPTYQKRIDKYLAWLEKQGEQKHVITPKFRIGDTIKNKTTNEVFTITDRCISLEYYHDINHLHEVKFSEQDNWELVEQKPADKVEPKFEIGDLITNGILIGKIDEINEHSYHAYFGDHYADVPDIENWHKWTIQDAKDGDVLCCESGWTCLFKALDNHTNTFSSYCFMDSDKWFCNTGSEGHTLDKAFIKAYNGEIHPATKKQRDLLFQKMKEAGYTFDFEKKELKKIESKTAAWTPMDEQHVENLLAIIEGHGYPGEVEWLNSLEDRVQSKQGWSEEDERIRIETIELLETANHPNVLHRNGKLLDFTENINWLKSLRPQKLLTNEEIEQAKKEYRDVALSKMDYIPEELTYDDGWDDAISYIEKVFKTLYLT